MFARRQRAVFAGSLIGLWLVFVIQAINTPVLLDDWYQLTYWRHHDFSLASLWEYGRYNYFNYNPRIGDVFLAMINGPPIVHIIVTPLVQLAVLPITFAIAFARWPRPTLADLWLLLLIQTLLWLVIPFPGVIYFYRPFATNYLWGFTITCALAVPYRLALAGNAAPSRPSALWAVPMMVLGWTAGMCNEHTGPAAMLAIAIFVWIAHRRRQLRAWMVGGALGLFIGYPMLFLAPGQSVRYAGLAVRNTPTVLLKTRGLDGCFEIVLDFLGNATFGIVFVAVAILFSLRGYRRAGERPPALPRQAVITATILLMTAGAILVTLFASPTAAERMFYAPGVLMVGAIVVVFAHLLAAPHGRRMIIVTAAVIFAFHVVRFVETYWSVKQENDDRIALLRATPKGEIAHVPPYSAHKRTRAHWGDDFRYASLREYVANEVFDLRDIAITRETRWSQPAPTDHYIATRIYDPPLPAEAAAAVAPLPYIPTYWEWTMVQFRRQLLTTELGDYQGHKLVRYTISAVGLPFVDPHQPARPVLVVDWTPRDSFQFVDGRPFDDKLGRPHIQIWHKSLPAAATEAYALDCGTTRPIALLDTDENDIGPIAPIDLACRGVHTLLVCEPTRCWLAGRYWK